ncbi:hypothetical protein [Streptomyces sp. YKOK-I1]
MRTEHHDHAAEPDDVLAAPDLLALDGAVTRGDGEAVSERIGGALLGRPLLYLLKDGQERALLVCFPFDLEELPGGRRYEEVTLTVRLDDDLYALSLDPSPGTTTDDGTRIAAFGLGGSRLRWAFRADGRRGGLRPDGHWAQAVVRTPADGTEVRGQVSLRATTVQRVLGGTLRRRHAETPHDTDFRIPVAEAWPTAATPAPRTDLAALPGAWALPAYEDHKAGTDDLGGERLPPGLRRLCLAVDIEKYSTRDNAGMVRLQRVLLRTLRRACERADVVWDRCGRQAQGDGYLLVLEPGTDETRAVPRLLDGLAEGLAAADGHPAPRDTRTIRMRAGLHQGIVHDADSGYAGSAVVDLFRVLDSGPVHRALDESPDAPLVVAFSDPLYRDIVGVGYDGLAADGFRRVEIEIAAKNFTGVAWIRAVRPAAATGG